MRTFFLSGIFCLLLFSYKAKAQTGIITSKIQIKKSENMKQVLIDKFIVPEKSKQEFLERVASNRNIIKHLSGFIKDDAYELTDDKGNLIYMTIAVWENEHALKRAKDTVQTKYKKEGFNIAEMLARLNISIERNVYNEALKP